MSRSAPAMASTGAIARNRRANLLRVTAFPSGAGLLLRQSPSRGSLHPAEEDEQCVNLERGPLVSRRRVHLHAVVREPVVVDERDEPLRRGRVPTTRRPPADPADFPPVVADHVAAVPVLRPTRVEAVAERQVFALLPRLGVHVDQETLATARIDDAPLWVAGQTWHPLSRLRRNIDHGHVRAIERHRDQVPVAVFRKEPFGVEPQYRRMYGIGRPLTQQNSERAEWLTRVPNAVKRDAVPAGQNRLGAIWRTMMPRQRERLRVAVREALKFPRTYVECENAIALVQLVDRSRVGR